MAGTATTTLLLATTALAQAAPKPPRLTPTGRVHAYGNGIAGGLCFVTPDSKRAVTFGTERDAVWWDLAKRQVLRHVDPPGPEFQSATLHPSEPWLVWLTTDGRGLRIDLDTGQREELGKAQVEGLPLPAGQDWLRDARPWQGEAATSPNGKFRVVREDGRWRRAPNTIHRFAPGWIANDGTILELAGNELILTGKSWWQVQSVPAPYCGAPTNLTFSRDGSFLAVMSRMQTQVTDAAGSEVATLPGPCELTAGAEPDEFWVMERVRMQRWKVTTRQFVGEWFARYDTTNPLGPLLVGEGRLPPHPPSLPLFHYLVDVAVPRAPGGEFTLTTTVNRKALDLVAAAFSGRPEQLGDAAIPCAIVSRCNAHMVVMQTVRFDGYARWLTFAQDQTHLAVGLADGSVHLLTAETLQPVTKATFAVPYVAAVALGTEQLLVSTGTRLQRLDAKTLALLGDVALPEGFVRVDQLVASPDSRRLAIACGSNVRILTIE